MNRRDFAAGVVTGAALSGTGIILFNRDWSSGTDPAAMLRELAQDARGLVEFQQSGIANESTLANLEQTLLDAARTHPDAFASTAKLKATLERIMLDEIQAGKVDSINGVMMSPTEANFVRYASLIIDEPVEKPGADIRGDFATNPKFGPRATVVGQVFNEQADGHGGIWVKSETPLPETTKIEIAGETVKTTWRSDVVTGAVYGQLLNRVLSQPGEYPVALIDAGSGHRQIIGKLSVKKRPPPAKTLPGNDSNVFCEVSGATLRGTGTDSTLLIDTKCAPRTAKLLIGQESIDAKLGPSGLTAKVTREQLSSRGQRFQLFDPISTDTVDLSDISVAVR